MPRLELKDQFPSLRQEIIESEKARIDLLKYKLLAVAALGAVGLGVGNYRSGSPEFIYIVCIIPFVCIYIDLLCFHNNLRILVIARFLINNADPYEEFLCSIKGYVAKYLKKPGYFFELEDWSLQWSSVALSSIITLFGLFFLYSYFRSGLTDKFLRPIFIIVGIVGIILPITISKVYNKHVTILFQCGETMLRESHVANNG